MFVVNGFFENVKFLGVAANLIFSPKIVSAKTIHLSFATPNIRNGRPNKSRVETERNKIRVKKQWIRPKAPNCWARNCAYNNLGKQLSR